MAVNRVINAQSLEADESFNISLRPKSLDECVGQRQDTAVGVVPSTLPAVVIIWCAQFFLQGIAAGARRAGTVGDQQRAATAGGERLEQPAESCPLGRGEYKAAAVTAKQYRDPGPLEVGYPVFQSRTFRIVLFSRRIVQRQ